MWEERRNRRRKRGPRDLFRIIHVVPVFPIRFSVRAVSEEGSLHAEKYYRTVSEEFEATRPAFRWRHLVALARVTASEYGRTAPGYAESRRLLKL